MPYKKAANSQELLESARKSYSMLRGWHACASFFIAFLRCLIISLVLISFWNLNTPLSWQENLILLGVLLLGFCIIEFARRSIRITEGDFVKSLDIMFPGSPGAPWSFRNQKLAPDHPSFQEWEKILKQFLSTTAGSFNRSLVRDLSSLLIPLLLTAICFFSDGLTPLSHTFNSAFASLTSSHKNPVLTVLQGSPETGSEKSSYRLSPGSSTDIDLISPNLVRVSLNNPLLSNPVITLGSPEGSDGRFYQSFRMTRSASPGDGGSNNRLFQVTFSVDQSVRLKLPALYGDKVLASLNIKSLPVPRVSLSLDAENTEPWPDERPLPLSIEIKTMAPLKLVRLLIKTGRRESRELVVRINSDKVFHHKTEYELLLEPYINTDLAEVEVTAEATDSAIPRPLTGYSKPVYIRTESAYGRYRQTLTRLRDVKNLLDDTMESKSPKIPEEALELARKALAKSESTPFFDTLDRIQIHSFANSLNLISTTVEKYQKILTLSQSLNEFLVEHEILDDRERDRDFFVAARALSRLIEQDPEKRPVPVNMATDNLRQFIENRRERWTLRARHLQHQDSLKMWNTIRDEKPFLSALDTIDSHIPEGKAGRQTEALQILSRTVAKYRRWIESLERQEDTERQSQEARRQSGLASARETLKKLQRRQGKISGELDQAVLRKTPELAEKWPVVRMKQNTIIRDTKKLEYKMRALAPRAGGRIKAAIEAMEYTLKSGQAQKFVKAESFSDLAGRLLRRAERESMNSKSSQKRRRRRRVSGDRYYGQSIHGGDLEISRDYQVDKRYREEILNEVRDAEKSEEDARLLEDYIRKIIR